MARLLALDKIRMPKLDAKQTARLLVELGRRAQLAGDNPYRARAYSRAAETLSAMTTPLEAVVQSGGLTALPGIGDTIADIVEQLHRTGTHPTLEQMRADVPEGVVEMLAIPGLRPEKVSKLYKDLGIRSLVELEEAARSGRLAAVKGIGPALERKILEGIGIARRGTGARLMHRAAEVLAIAREQITQDLPQLKRVVAAGDVRRGAELVFDLALVAEAEHIDGEPQAAQSGDVTVHLTDAKRLGISLLRATGSEAHLDQLQALASEQGMTLTASGLLRNGKVVAAKTEADIYGALSLQFIPPELREGRGEIDMARQGAIPELVVREDIRGIVHAHTVASDGGNTLQEMAAGARDRGYEYFGVADHSISAHYAGGLTVEEIEAQHAEIDALNARYARGFRIFKGIESDILSDGSLDYPDAILDRFEFVVASVHGGFRMGRREQTDRILRAVANPHTTILGHPTGRQLLRRDGYEVDVERVLEACARHGVVVEINCNPLRLDLDWRWHKIGVDMGCVFSVNPDAHSVAEIDMIPWGIEVARKGGLSRDKVLNCLPLKDMAAFLAARTKAWRGKSR